MSPILKIERVMAIYVHQGDMKYQFNQILKSQNLAQPTESEPPPW